MIFSYFKHIKLVFPLLVFTACTHSNFEQEMLVSTISEYSSKVEEPQNNPTKNQTIKMKQTNGNTPPARIIKTFTDPQFNAYSFQYPSNYKAGGGFLNDMYAYPYATLESQNKQDFIFINDPHSFGYMPVNQVFGGYEGQMYMGCMLVNNIDEYTHAGIALQKKGLQNIKVGNPINETSATGKKQTAYPVSCTDANGTQWHGKVYVNFSYIENMPVILPFESGYLTTNNDTKNIENDFKIVGATFKPNMQVVNQLGNEKNSQMQQATVQNQNYVNQLIENMQAFDKQILNNADKTIDIINNETQRMNPYTGKVMKISESNDQYYFINQQGQIISNNTGISPNADYMEMKEYYK